MSEAVHTFRQLKDKVRVLRGHDKTEKPAQPYAAAYRDVAILSALAYHKPENDSLPLHLSPGWEQWRSRHQREPTKQGLYFDTWVKKAPTENQILVAFRGTDDAPDWWSNAYWVTRFIPAVTNQYQEVRADIADIVTEAKERFTEPGKTLRFISTGHSLGGGLAQHAAYATQEIKEVYAFDPSPVTGYRSIPAAPENAKGVQIARIYEKGEILAYLRYLMRKVYQLSLINPEIIEVRFDFATKGDPIAQHSMYDLAHNLVNLSQQHSTPSPQPGPAPASTGS